VGFTAGFPRNERKALLARLLPLVRPPGFTGNAPGGPSRWSSERSAEWEPLAPKLVVEVGYDHVTSGRFRHGTRLLRWRPDKAPHQCTMAQIEAGAGPKVLTGRGDERRLALAPGRRARRAGPAKRGVARRR
jgi:ATP-dependent DNA ligase